MVLTVLLLWNFFSGSHFSFVSDPDLDFTNFYGQVLGQLTNSTVILA